MAVDKKTRLKPSFSTKRKKLEQDLEHITQEMYLKNLELTTTNHTLSLLRAIDNLVLESQSDISALSIGIANAMVEGSNYPFSMIFMRERNEKHLPMLLRGLGDQSTEKPNESVPSELVTLKVESADKWFESEENSRVVNFNADDKHFLTSIFKSRTDEVVELAKKLNCNELCLVKLLARGSLIGLMIVGSLKTGATLGNTEREHLGRIGEAIGIAIDNRLLYEENQHVLKKLKQSNEKLKALDEAKDEFISMASHQLRTPLTSVKGYLSMVLEGDVGKVSKNQRELLDQAFTSSQRMVYLIADLLNVSRLRTGKFVIEPTPTYLPDVVEGEVSQLNESASVHELELCFEKPDKFPTLNLDETKVRQVIMNFMDNAIYYTPPGGHIKVLLTANSRAVEYRVLDDGLGVPKHEQHHLFTKFFRAANARKARPDGTGLGLFMAKKVIVAQGGAIIFESEEGKGSTFGFSFPRKALEVKPVAVKPAAPIDLHKKP